MFRDAKVGDRVWSMPLGWGTIIEISPYAEDHALEVKWDLDGACGYYGLDGKVYKSDLMPFLFWDEIQITPPPKPKKKVKKTVDVWINFYPGNRHYIHYSKQAADVGFTGEGKPGELRAAPATLTYEIEE